MAKNRYDMSLLPCGKKDCNGCEVCKYDLPLDAPLKNISKMKSFELFPSPNNPATAQIILPGVKVLPPVGSNIDSPYKGVMSKNCSYCNGCNFFVKLKRPNKESFNTRCSAETPRPGGSYRVIKLNVFPDEKVEKPFWCPVVKDKIINGGSGEKRITVGGGSVYAQKNSTVDMDREKWLGVDGLKSWDDIKPFEVYHLPPVLKKKRMDLRVKVKYLNSIQCENIKTGETIWLYKSDEEYKFMSEIK